jgi:hypothetical protein
MATWVHVPSKTLYQRKSPAQAAAIFGIPIEDFCDANGKPTPPADILYKPDLSAVEITPGKYWHTRYWNIVAGVISLMSAGERAGVDAAMLSARRDSIVDELVTPETLWRNFALELVDELNRHADRHDALRDAIINANNLADVKQAMGAITDFPQRTAAQLRDRVRIKADI